MYSPIDDMIPFCEWFAIPYVLWFPMLAAAAIYLLYNSCNGYKLYTVYIGLSFMSTLLIYVLFPNGQELRVTQFQNSNILTDFVSYLYSCDTNTNVCPSLHVIGSFAAVFGVFYPKKIKRPVCKVIIVISAILIAISTVFIKQHSIVDVAAGILMSAVVWVIVYSKHSIIRRSIEKGQHNEKSN